MQLTLAIYTFGHRIFTPFKWAMTEREIFRCTFNGASITQSTERLENVAVNNGDSFRKGRVLLSAKTCSTVESISASSKGA